MESSIIVASFVVAILFFIAGAAYNDEEHSIGAIFTVFGVVALSGVYFLTSNHSYGTIAKDEKFPLIKSVFIEPGVAYEKTGSIKVDNKYAALVRKKGAREWKAYWFSEDIPSEFNKIKMEDGQVKYFATPQTQKAQ